MSWKTAFTIDAMYSPRMQRVNQAIAIVIVAVFALALTMRMGLPMAIIVAGSAAIGFFCWRATNLRRPFDPVKSALLFLLTTAALHVHMYEEHRALFGPAMSRLFNLALPDERFLQVFVFSLPVIYYITAVGLLLRVPLAAFVAWFIFIGPGIAEFTHFLFPLITPALHPSVQEPVTAIINGVRVDTMPNYHIGATGTYYFPGLYTAILPMIPGIYAVCWLFAQRRAAAGSRISETARKCA